MKKELIDVLDENGVFTGQVLPRDEVHKRGLWHRAILVAIINEKNEILLQQRSKTKEKNAGMWDLSSAGHVSFGEDSLTSAFRETYEELGYKAKISDFRYIFSFRKEQIVRTDFVERQFYDFYLLKTKKLNTNLLKLQKEEVENVKFCDLNEIKNMIINNEMVERPEIYSYIFLKILGDKKNEEINSKRIKENVD